MQGQEAGRVGSRKLSRVVVEVEVVHDGEASEAAEYASIGACRELRAQGFEVAGGRVLGC
jgi:hypothetical protein